MDSRNCDPRGTVGYLPATVCQSLKIVIIGAFGVGKTTMVGSVSEIRPLSTEEPITVASADADSLAAVPEKTTTTVALDFGRITLDSEVVLCLFGAPGQPRFWSSLDWLTTGAIGAVVLVDLRRLDASFAILDQLDRLALHYIVVINMFPDTPDHTDHAIRAALDLPADIVLRRGDVRETRSSIDTLIDLVALALARPDPAKDTA